MTEAPAVGGWGISAAGERVRSAHGGSRAGRGALRMLGVSALFFFHTRPARAGTRRAEGPAEAAGFPGLGCPRPGWCVPRRPPACGMGNEAFLRSKSITSFQFPGVRRRHDMSQAFLLGARLGPSSSPRRTWASAPGPRRPRRLRGVPPSRGVRGRPVATRERRPFCAARWRPPPCGPLDPLRRAGASEPADVAAFCPQRPEGARLRKERAVVVTWRKQPGPVGGGGGGGGK